MKPAWMVLTLSCGLMWAGAGCSQTRAEQKMDGLTGVVFNYSDEAIAEVRVEGELLGVGLEGVRPGGVMGGGRMCCMAMDPTRSALPVQITPAIGAPYEVMAQVEQPWPKDATTAIAHVLPGRKVVIETSLGYAIAPRRDLLEGQLDALGIEMEVDETNAMIPRRHRYTEYMDSGR